jgi:4-hydroxybenzoate polyprenyltransferase
MSKIFRFLLIEILYNGHLQSLGSVGIVYLATQVLLAQPPSIGILVLTYAVFQFIYIFDRAKDLKKDKSTNIERTQHIASYAKRVPLVLVTLIICIIVGFLIFSNITSLIAALFVIFMGSLYPVYFKGLTKYIFMFKNLYVSSVHALLVLFPFIYYAKAISNWSLIIVLLVFVLIEVIIMQIALDMKDIKGDKHEGLKTFPVVMGNKTSIFTEGVLLTLSFILFNLVAVFLHLALIFVLIVWTSAVVNILIVRFLVKGTKLAYLLSAAKFFVWFCVLIVANMVLWGLS